MKNRLEELRQELIESCLRYDKEVRALRNDFMSNARDPRQFALAVAYYLSLVLRLAGMSEEDQMMVYGNIVQMAYETPEEPGCCLGAKDVQRTVN